MGAVLSYVFFTAYNIFYRSLGYITYYTYKVPESEPTNKNDERRDSISSSTSSELTKSQKLHKACRTFEINNKVHYQSKIDKLPADKIVYVSLDSIAELIHFWYFFLLKESICT